MKDIITTVVCRCDVCKLPMNALVKQDVLKITLRGRTLPTYDMHDVCPDCSDAIVKLLRSLYKKEPVNANQN